MKGADLSLTNGKRPFSDEDDDAELDEYRDNGDGRIDGCRGPPEEGEEPNNKAKYGQDENCRMEIGGPKNQEGEIQKDESSKTERGKNQKVGARKLITMSGQNPMVAKIKKVGA